jgi:galactose mutarotase-like enzyme
MILLQSEEAEATIALRGAEPRRWRVAGQDLLWQEDPHWWPKTSPVLFPVVGRVRGGVVRVGGTTYPMPLHGFAAASGFRVAEQSASQVRLVLSDDEASRRNFPFGFTLSVTYALQGRSLSARFQVSNPGPLPLPYALGLHPGFAWSPEDAAAEAHAINFAQPERPEVPEITTGGFFTKRNRPVPLRGCHLPLSPALFAAEALCFLQARSEALRFSNGARGSIDVLQEGFPHLALWSRPGAPFLCIESWTGYGDPEDFAGELQEKPSMLLLPPGKVAEHAVRYTHVLAER